MIKLEAIESGFFDRMKKIEPIRMLGTGMDVGELNEFSHEICFLILLNIFRRELTENPNRTRVDMIHITEEIVRDMGIETSKDNIERIVDGTLWYREPSKQENFSSTIYNEQTKKREEYVFRYLKEDREHSHWEEGGSTVYMLTEESQEMIFITREILEEFGFDVEQFYTLQLIKTGNFTKAKGSVDNLIARVRTLIKREKDHRQDMIRDPQVIFFDRQRNARKTEEEIRKQFEDEQSVFEDMFSWKSRYESLPDEKKYEAELMFENLEKARILHDNLAKIVMENIAYEMEVRVKFPESFWKTSNVSFKKDIWKNTIVKNGLRNFDQLEYILSPLFSPQVDFIYPLSWAWEEQMVRTYTQEIIEYDEEEEEENWFTEETDWELIVELWSSIFDSLLEKGHFSIEELNEISDENKEKWLSQRENIELFMMFAISEVVLIDNFEGIDERLKLFSLLCESDEKYRVLHEKKIKSKIETDKEPLLWREVHISPYTIYVEEEKDELFK